ncbi:MAG: tRNA (adenosine(37)-N6)-dimethylallyltransferase MiaA [Chloroflexi bacterium]|nr:tRNA (adenosine(37)-N6)-dimethylallyltransferase MiaA [Chloroflexota bacterium]
MRPPLLVVLGPTASGKSGLGIALALRLQGEIISADSRQVYRGMDLGTAKVTPEERRLVPHHLLDVAEPSQDFSLAHYQALAYAAILDVARRGKLPLLVGGTGLYLSAVVDNYLLPQVPPRAELRRELEGLSVAELARRLREVDPQAAARVDLANPRRVVRALEVALSAPGAAVGRQGEPLVRALQLGLSWPRAELYRRIDRRVDERLAQGMVDEARRLLAQGVSHGRLEAFGLEYRFLSRSLRGELPSLEAMAAQLKTAIHAYARRQLTWFRRDPRIHWLDATGDAQAEAEERVARFREGADRSGGARPPRLSP